MKIYLICLMMGLIKTKILLILKMSLKIQIKTKILLNILKSIIYHFLKEKLFKHTIEQLKQTFEKNDLDKLQNLYFDFDNQQPNLEDNGEDKPEPAVIELAEQRKK